MTTITKHITDRRSVRTYDGKALTENDKEKLCSFMEKIENPFDIPVEFKMMNAKEYGLNCPVVTGTELFVAGKVKCVPDANVAFGYSFEKFVLFAQSLGIGTVWLGGTMNRSAFEAAMELEDDEFMPCASPLGYPASKMSMREIMMRKGVKADERLPFEDMFFEGSFDTPLVKEKAGALAQPLEMVRLSPSAVNKQPWRVLVIDNMAHFYLKRSKGFGHEGNLDMQKIDMGIALCHFALTAGENDLHIKFMKENPMVEMEPDMEYIASYQFNCR